MTPEKAQHLLTHFDEEDCSNQYCPVELEDLIEAEAFLAGIAHEQKKSQGLIEALERLIKHNEIVAGNTVYYSMNYRIAKEALETYRIKE